MAVHYWRRFEGWAIRSTRSPLVVSRLELAAVYAVSIILLAVAFAFLDVAVNIITRAPDLSKIFDMSFWTMVAEQIVAQNWDFTLTLLLGIAIPVGFTIGFFLSGIALKPVENILRSRKRFIADAAHELRTPLSIMKTNAEVALAGGAEPDAQELREVLRDNLEETDRMTGIINNLLVLSRFDSKKSELEFHKVSFGEIARQAMKALEGLAERKNVSLSTTGLDRGVIWGNQTALEEVAVNIIKNAITYTPAGGAVTVSVQCRPKYMLFTVRDSGVGINKKDLAHVFDPFFRGDRARTRGKEKHFGLGLTLAQEIITQHQGAISIASPASGGTRVRVRLPGGMANCPSQHA